MAYTPQTWTNGSAGSTPLSAARLNHMEDGIEDLDTRVALIESGYAVRVYALSSGQTIASGAYNQIDFTNTEFNDSTNFYTVDLTGNIITVLQSGLYLVVWELLFDGGSTGARAAAVEKNGSQVRESSFAGTSGSTSGAASLRLSANDELGLFGYVDGGTTVNLETSSLWNCGLSVTRLGA